MKNPTYRCNKDLYMYDDPALQKVFTKDNDYQSIWGSVSGNRVILIDNLNEPCMVHSLEDNWLQHFTRNPEA